MRRRKGSTSPVVPDLQAGISAASGAIEPTGGQILGRLRWGSSDFADCVRRGVTVTIEPGLMDKVTAGEYLGKARVLRVCREAGWIVPVEQRGTMVLYSVAQLKELVAKIEREGLP